MDVRLPDGTLLRGVPEGTTKAQLYEKLKANGYDVSKLDAPEQEASTLDKIKQGAADLAAGAVRGAGSIGATILAPVDAAARALNDGKPVNVAGYDIVGQDRRAGMDAGLRELGADTGSLAFQAGKLGTEVAGTMGAGGAAANVLGRALPAAVAARAAPALEAVRTAGMSAGGLQGAGGLAVRSAGGAVAGGLSAGMVDPADAGMGAAVGGALPGALKLAKAGGQLAASVPGRAVRAAAGELTPERIALAKRAQELGIDIPADRIADSKVLNAAASTLNYVPFSGRGATESKMNEQLSRAVSRLMGQDTPNISQAIRKAGEQLGAEFDRVLKGTGVAFDEQLLNDVAGVLNKAKSELSDEAVKPVMNQADEMFKKGAEGFIDGQAAYNIKRTLDRIAKSPTPVAYHAEQLRGTLMDAMNRSMGPEAAKAFAKTRAQYGNMKALEKIAANGVDGEISAARLANLKNINNKDLQELADIAATFIKPRESAHGSMQRAVFWGAVPTAVAGPVGLAGGATVGRAANAMLTSPKVINAMTGAGFTPAASGLPALPASQLQQMFLQSLMRGAPSLAGQTDGP
jgi:hypothetical protein